ncbi:phage terminase large subunit [Klebsiella variicola]|nr:phage terminase large subunit [Klebsiella variicola]
MTKRASAKGIRRDVSGILRAPRRMQVADAVSSYMRVPMGRVTPYHGTPIWPLILLSR